MTTTPALPPVGARDPAAHRAMALRFLDHAQVELDRGHRLQASEKAWGAVAHELKALAIERGWEHESHVLYRRMVNYLTKEYGLNDDLRWQVSAADRDGHRNFYENEYSTPEIQDIIDDARKAVATIEGLRGRRPQPYTIDNEAEQDWVESLTGWRFERGHRRKAGFANLPAPPIPPKDRQPRQHSWWDDTYPNDPENPSATGGRRPQPPTPSGGAPAAAVNDGAQGDAPSRTSGTLRSALDKAKAKVGLKSGLGSARALRRRRAPASRGDSAAPAAEVEVIYK